MRTQRGNILFLILLAVVLFAALSYAVTNAVRGGNKDASSEQAKAYAAEITQYGSLVANAVNRLRLVNGCRENEISFQNSIDSGYTNSQSPADGRCKVFDPAGGGLNWKTADTKWLDPYFTGSPWNSGYGYGTFRFPSNTSFANVGTFVNGNNMASVDLTLNLHFLSDSVCKAINDSLGLPFPLYSTGATTGSLNSYWDTAKFMGHYTSCSYPTACNYFAALRSATSASSPIITAEHFCVTGYYNRGFAPETGKPNNSYIHTLIAR